jgi:ABC-type sugar transport system ATPase subunit
MAAITLERVEKVFERGRGGVSDVNLEAGDGELLVLVGPSGSGKSTTLRLIAGLESPTRGRILIGGRDVTAVPPQARDLAMVFQSYALYPHLSVRDNLGFGLRMRRLGRDVIDRRVGQVAATLKIEELLDRKPAQLSGGQRQRVALGRAIVREPQAFLFDEPLSNLDAALRLETRTELALLHRRLGATMIYVTHDQEEAMKLGDRIVVMRDGRIDQAGPPTTVYSKPETLFVARFVGSPPMNVLTRGLGALDVPHGRVLGIRPHDIKLVDAEGRDADAMVTVDLVEPIGSEQHVHVTHDEPGGQKLIVVSPPDRLLRVGGHIGVNFRRDRLHMFDAASGRRLA